MNPIAHYIGRSPIHPVPFLIGKAAFLCSGFFFIVKWISPGILSYDHRILSVVGVLFIATGFCLAGIALLHLGESVAVGIPDRETTLKTRGLYKFSRNPIYLSGSLMCLGSCLYAVHWLNGLCFAVALAVHHAIVLKEEEFLEKKFGDAWREYRKTVPRYFGF